MIQLIRFLIILMILIGGGVILAQETNPEPVPPMPPQLMSIAPATLPYGQSATITLNGTGFTPDTLVSLETLGNVACTFISDTQMTITVPATLAGGQYDISISNTAGNSQLTDSLTIQSQPTPTPTPLRVSVNRTEPLVITAGQSGVLSVQGANFTQSTIVRLAGIGLLPTTYLHSGALTATLTETLAAGDYSIDVVDPERGTATATTRLRVLAAPPIFPTLEPLPTANPITREPALALTRVSTSPNLAQPGQTITLSFTVTNRGNQTARLISITLGDTTDVALAAGQTSFSVPDLLPGGSYNGQLSITINRAVESELVSMPLAVTYRDPDGKLYTETARASVTISYAAQLAQLLIDGYVLEPQRMEAGDDVTLRMTIVNRGTVEASQVMLRIAGEHSLLLPNGASDTFFVGTVAPGQRVPLELSLRVSSKAAAGAQLQPITLMYIQEGDAKEIPTSITLDIAASSKPQPQIILSRYEIDPERLQPGSRFSLTTYFQNVGSADAADMTVTFGTVQSTTTPDTGSPPDPNTPNNNGGSQSSTSSTTFAPLNSAGIVYVGAVPVADDPFAVEQGFIVSGTTASGIYSLPVTLRYTLPDGTTRQDNLGISLVVVAPPRLLVNPPNPLPEMMPVGEPLPVTLTLKNAGTRNINLTDARFSVTNGEIMEGAETVLQTLKAGEETTVTAVIVAQDEGTQTVTAQILYLDEINQPQIIEFIYETQIIIPEPPPMEEPPVEQPPSEPTPEPVDWFGRVMMALLGLGS